MLDKVAVVIIIIIISITSIIIIIIIIIILIMSIIIITLMIASIIRVIIISIIIIIARQRNATGLPAVHVCTHTHVPGTQQPRVVLLCAGVVLSPTQSHDVATSSAMHQVAVRTIHMLHVVSSASFCSAGCSVVLCWSSFTCAMFTMDNYRTMLQRPNPGSAPEALVRSQPYKS